MKILSLDQALKKTGYAVFENADLIKYGDIDYSKEDVIMRLPLMCEHIYTLIYKYKPDFVIFEGVTLLQDHIQTLINLAQLQGCIIQMCLNEHIEYGFYQPTYWRRILGIEQSSNISRHQYKKKSINYVKKCYGINVNEDAAEAICIALAFLYDKKIIK